MSSNSSTNGRLKGVYLRGKVFWYRYSYEGHQYRVSLETDDHAQAITKALRIQANPVLAGADPLSEEITKYVAVSRTRLIRMDASSDVRQVQSNTDRRITVNVLMAICC